MDRTTQRTVSTVLALVGVLMFIVPPDLIRPDLARFLGIAFMVVSGGLYGLPKTDAQDATEDQNEA